MSPSDNNITLVNGIETDYISVDDRGLNYGDGLFETLAVVNGKPIFWSQHWQRLQYGAKVLGINCPEEKVSVVRSWIAGAFVIGSFVIFMIIKHILR